MRAPRIFTALVAAAALVGCSDREATGPEASLSPAATASALSPVPGVREVVGETGPGSSYALLVPAEWNGELVVYAHGYIQPFFEPTLDVEAVIAPVRDSLLREGFAFAYSSWSETGYAVRDGAQRTHQLNGLFTSAFGSPTRTYLLGLSLGGLVVESLAERFPGQYDGTLALCGVMGGGMYNAAYVADFRLLFDVFFPGVLPGSVQAMPAGAIVAPGSELFNRILGALSTPQGVGRAMEMAAMDQVALQYASINELISSFIQVLGYQVNGANALSERLQGHWFYDNTGVRYTGSSDDDAVNAAVARYPASPSAENYMAHWWEPAGAIDAPFVTLHTSRDPLVPARVEAIFAETVAGAGNGALLLQRTTDAFGHCAFTDRQVLESFRSLQQWVATGDRPAE